MAVIDDINDKQMSISILETIENALSSETQKAALRAVADYIRSYVNDDVTKLTYEERKARILELLAKERDSMTNGQRRERAAFYLEGISA